MRQDAWWCVGVIESRQHVNGAFQSYRLVSSLYFRYDEASKRAGLRGNLETPVSCLLGTDLCRCGWRGSYTVHGPGRNDVSAYPVLVSPITNLALLDEVSHT